MVSLNENIMEIKEITEKKEWEDFIQSVKPHTFLESWQWGEFNRVMGDRVWRLGIYDENNESRSMNHELAGVALVIKIAAKRGTFLFVPHGPLLREAENFQSSRLRQGFGGQAIFNYQLLTDYLKKLAQEEQCSFIRISPLLLKNPENEKMFKDLGFRKAPMHMHPEFMWLLDISTSDIDILKDMRKTTRYEIKKAEREGVEISHGTSLEQFEIFSKLYRSTAHRQHFHAFSGEYLRQELDVFEVDNQIEIFLAKYNGEYIAGAMIIFYADSAFYHQGASSGAHPKIGAPYLLHWEIIKEAKKRGLQFYNFWGISSETEPRHPWAGLSLFKRGFGGFAEEYVPTQDLVLKHSYWASYIIEKMRKINRGL